MAESTLSHYKNARSSLEMYEVLQPNLFQVIINPPAGLSGNDQIELLHEHINTIGGLQGLNPATEIITQKFKSSTRSFVGNPSETAIDISIDFSLNLNDNNQAYTYKILRDWYRLAFDPDTGYAGLKKDYTGSMEILQHNRNGEVYRRIVLHDIFITTAPEAMDSLDYSSSDPFTASATFRCDYYEEELS